MSLPPVFSVDQLPTLQPLPIRVAPFLDETLDSYLDRLAWANRLDRTALRRHLSGSRLKSVPVPIARLAALTGYRKRSLRYAILELSTDDERVIMTVSNRPWPGPEVRGGCHRCLHKLSRMRNSPGIIRLQHPEDMVICLRHRRWIQAATSFEAQQPDLSPQPDILRAHRMRRRLNRRGYYHLYGALLVAERIVSQWAGEEQHKERFHQRMRIFHGEAWLAKVPRQHPTISAARYPEVIALARLLTVPYWRSLALDTHDPVPDDRFLAEVRRTVAPGYEWSDHRFDDRNSEPLAKWIITERKEQRRREEGLSLREADIARGVLARAGHGPDVPKDHG